MTILPQNCNTIHRNGQTFCISKIGHILSRQHTQKAPKWSEETICTYKLPYYFFPCKTLINLFVSAEFQLLIAAEVLQMSYLTLSRDPRSTQNYLTLLFQPNLMLYKDYNHALLLQNRTD